MPGLRATEAEFRALFVDKLQLVDPGDFERARAMADRLQLPLERALAERGEIDDHIRRMIMESRDGVAVREAAIARGMKTMFQDGLAKMLLGETTLEEIFRVAV